MKITVSTVKKSNEGKIYLLAIPGAVFQLSDWAVVGPESTSGVVLANIIHIVLLLATNAVVATRVLQPAGDCLQCNVAGVEQSLPAARTLATTFYLQGGSAFPADVVSALTDCDGRNHIFVAYRTCQHLEYTLPHGLAAGSFTCLLLFENSRHSVDNSEY